MGNILEREAASLIEQKNQTFERMEVTVPLEGHTGTSLRNIVNMLASKERLIMKSFNLEEALVDDAFAEELSEKEITDTESFKKAFLEARPERCPGLAFDFEEGLITFALEAEAFTPEQAKAWSDLVGCLNVYAKTLKHASFKPSSDENPKFTFRVWLTRLGLNGEGYKGTRKTLLAPLEGNSAFRKPKKK